MSAQQQEQIEQLQASLSKMQLALEVIADAVVWVGEEQQIQWCNSSFERLINQFHSQIIGSRFSEILPLFQSEQPVAIEAYPDVQMHKGNYITTNYEFKQKDNWLLLQISGKCAGLNDKSAVIVIRDITLVRPDHTCVQQVEQSLQESDEHLQTLINASPDIICFKDGAGRWLESNQANLEFLGLQGVEYKGKTDIELAQYSIFDRDALLNCIQTDEQAWQKGSLYRVEEVIARSDGTVSIFDMIKIPLFQHDGRRKGLLTLGRDISDSKRAEEALRRSEQKYRNIFENSLVGIGRTRLEDGLFLEINQPCAEIIGYSYVADLIGKRYAPEFHVNPGDRSWLLTQIEQHGEVRNFEIQLRRRDGVISWGLMSARANKEESCLDFMIVDISDRKLAEEASKASEARLNTILDSALAAIYRIRVYAHRDWDFEYCSPKSLQLWGYSPEELLADKTSFVSRILPEDLAAIYEKAYDDIFAGRTYEGEYRYNHPDGNLRWISLTITSVRDEVADYWIATVISTDISDRKQREVALSLIVEGTAAKTGDEFFSSCVRYLAQVLQVHHAVVTECIDETKTKARTLAVWLDKQSEENFEYEVRGTPCEQVLQGYLCYYPQKIQTLFPDDTDLVTVGAESYLGVPLINASGKILGHLAVIDNEPMVDDPGRELILRIFAARAGAELERKRAEQALQKSELKFRTMVENASDIISLMTLEGKITYVSPNMTGIMGYNVAELEEKYFAPFIHPDDVAVSFTTLQKIVEFGGNQSTEVRARHKNGSWRWLGSNVSKVVTLSGDEFIITCARDITERKIAEEALERRAQAESLLSSISRHFIDQDLDTAINFTLQAIAQFIGADRCCIFEYSQDRSHVHLSYEWCAANIEPLTYMAREGAVTMFPRLAEIAHGKVCQISCVANLPSDAPERIMFESQSIQSMVGVPMIHSDRVVGFVGADVIQNCKIWSQEEINFLKLVGELIAIGRARHQAEEALRVAKEAAEAANRAKSAFLANMSHELRTPLNAILGFAQLMERDPALNSRQRESLATINRSGEHLLNLIDDVLEMSKIEAGRVVFNPESFDLFGLLQTLQQMFQIRAQAKQLFLTFEIAPDLPQYIHTDEGKLRQVLINLLSNAVKFTQQGGVTLRARRGHREVGNQDDTGRWGHGEVGNVFDNVCASSSSTQSLIFEVEDTGCGIAPEEIENLFKPFVQTSSGIQMREGTGLGLTISHQFIRIMAGEIRAHSKLGQGSTFSFNVQVKTTQPLQAKTQLTKSRVLQLAPQQPHYRILVVDDRQENREPILQLLSSVGFEVEAATDGQQAIALWQTWQPQLVFMDMRMPVMDGYEATREIRAREATGQKDKETRGGGENLFVSRIRTVIIALTASAFEEQKATILAAGCDDLIRKPFREQVLFEKIAQHLGVSYLYAQPEAILAQEKNPQASPAILFSELITIMSAQWLAQLHQAALQVDGDRIIQLLEQIPQTHSALAEGITDLVRRFCFDEILELTGNLQ
ncbi:PAS domain S-box protein [Chlorogloeopsis sp. ULAP01]|uniref:PAS domain S-box protein n=1 Tax=Chlorogloeopsis sp. ULAP01 TaxID=3056483 RepID=UPI0025AA7810|nr:PAS domain S-box protein [Chlorogloeopsis sp. ULAP01]MDM9381306.1 PAS domain S-box protein [Chlorogloeopsis sp. ULAP01]